MHLTRLVQIGIAGSACAVMLFAADFWKTKDASQWTDDEISKVLSDSPWAKAKTVQPQQSQMARRGGGRRGGFRISRRWIGRRIIPAVAAVTPAAAAAVTRREAAAIHEWRK